MCGSEMNDQWVACPHCGHRWRDVLIERPEPKEPQRRRAGWYPNRRQWWVIWIAALLIVIGLMSGSSDGVTFALCTGLIAILLVWKLNVSGQAD